MLMLMDGNVAVPVESIRELRWSTNKGRATMGGTGNVVTFNASNLADAMRQVHEHWGPPPQTNPQSLR